MAEQQHNRDDQEKRDKVRRLSVLAFWASKGDEKIPVEDVTEETRAEVETLLHEQPIFYNEEKDAPKKITLDPAIKTLLTLEFLKNPTRWIEAQPNIDRGQDQKKMPTGESIAELEMQPYDISKVKIVTVGSKKIVIKRIDPREKTEIARARKAYKAGIPTPKVLGTIQDQGNTYAIFEHIEGHNLNSIIREWQDINVPVTSDDEELFRQTTEVYDYWQKLSSWTKKKLVKLWKKYLPVILLSEITNSLYVSRSSRNEYIKAAKEGLKLRKYPAQAVKTVLKFHGYNSVEEIADDYLDDYGERDKKKLDQMQEKAYAENASKFQEFRDEWDTICETELYGTAITREEERIRKLCDQNGIEHKDFAPRNWVLSSGKKPKLYLIDWEEKNIPS